MSWLPVPHSPFTVQVSITSTSEAGNSISRISGMPPSSTRMSPWSSTRQPPISQSLWSTPEVKGQRPVTR